MKKLIAIMTGLVALTSACVAGDIVDVATLRADNVTTNSGAIVTNTYENALSGELLGIAVDVGATVGPTVTVYVATHATSGEIDIAQILLDVTNVAADVVYPITDLKCSYLGTDITTAPSPFRLYNDYVYATFSNGCTNASMDVKVHLFIKRE